MAKLLTLPWPSYWPYFGQKMAKLLTPYSIYLYTYLFFTEVKEGEEKSAINLTKFREICQIWPGVFMYVGPVGSLQKYLC